MGVTRTGTAPLLFDLLVAKGRVKKWRGVVRRACGACQTVRFHSLLIEPDVQISRIRLSDKTSRLHPRRAAATLARRTRPKRSYSSGS